MVRSISPVGQGLPLCMDSVLSLRDGASTVSQGGSVCPYRRVVSLVVVCPLRKSRCEMPLSLTELVTDRGTLTAVVPIDLLDGLVQVIGQEAPADRADRSWGWLATHGAGLL